MGWDQKLDTPLSVDLPETSEGGQNKVWGADLETHEMLSEVLKQLKIMNMHLSMITDTNITKKEV